MVVRLALAMTSAIVKVFPEPVTPSRICPCSFVWSPSTSLAIAFC